MAWWRSDPRKWSTTLKWARQSFQPLLRQVQNTLSVKLERRKFDHKTKLRNERRNILRTEIKEYMTIFARELQRALIWKMNERWSLEIEAFQETVVRNLYLRFLHYISLFGDIADRLSRNELHTSHNPPLAFAAFSLSLEILIYLQSTSPAQDPWSWSRSCSCRFCIWWKYTIFYSTTSEFDLEAVHCRN